MSRLIDADKLIKELHEALDGSGYDEDYKDMGIDDFIMSQPTAYDAEKVVAELPTYEFGVSLLNTEKYVKLSDLKKKIDAIRKGGVE